MLKTKETKARKRAKRQKETLEEAEVEIRGWFETTAGKRPGPWGSRAGGEEYFGWNAEDHEISY